jgi:hypothetical protein
VGEPESKYDMSQRVISPKQDIVTMNRRVFLRATAGATVALTGCLGGGGDDEQQVDNEPYGRFTVVRNEGAGEIEVTVEDPMTADHAAIGGSHTFDGSVVIEGPLEQGDSVTLSVEDGEINESGSMEVFAVRGNISTETENGTVVLSERPDNFRSIDDEDNPFSYDFSDAVGD